MLLFVAMLAVALPAGDAAAQTVNRDDILYILPYWGGYLGADDAAVSAEITDLRKRVGPEGPYVKLGFSLYIFLSMQDWNVDISNPTAVRAAISTNITQIDDAVAKAHANGFPVALAIQTAIRERYDPVQSASEAEDIRSMQWYADNVLAGGWWTHSRYARKQFAIQQAYMREIAKEIARLMRQYPDTLVAASGDGEVELALAKFWNPSTGGPATGSVSGTTLRYNGQTFSIVDGRVTFPDCWVFAVADSGALALMLQPKDNLGCTPDPTYATRYADYSPFMVAEFRDWLRNAGLYAPGAIYAGQGYSLAARYAGDATPGSDTNGDGHTLNGDFGTSFQTWNLLHFDWSLSDQFVSADPHAIPLTAYQSTGYNKLPAQIPGGFDPPRTPKAIGADAWWDLWVLFKQTMLQHHNQEFAKWMTTSPEPATGATIPPARWYSDQVAADYLFNGSPQVPNPRWYSSMSSLSTADVSPYGSLGITAFNLDYRPAGASFTLQNAAPAIAARDVRWGIIEWHPGLLPGGGVSSWLGLFQVDMELVKQYRPSLLLPFGWDFHNYEIKDTLFQTTLAELVAYLKDGMPSNGQMAFDAPGATVTQPFTLTGWAVDLGKIPGPGRGPGIDTVHIYAYPNPGSGQAPIFLGSATYGGTRTDVAARYPSQFGQFTKSGFSLTVRGLPVGRYDLVAFGRSTVSETFNVSATVSVTVGYGAAALSPAMLAFGTTKAGSGGDLVATTPAQIITASYSGPGIPVWSASSSATWLQITSGPGVGQFTVAIVNPGNVIGGSSSLSGAVTITASNVGVGGSVPVTLTVKQVGTSTAPFGAFDTPADGTAGMQGSFAVTGWALDDVAIDRVEIWRDLVQGEDPTHAYVTDPSHPAHGKVFIASPLFVTDARPDVEALYSSYPAANRAGWGYLLLSWGLEGQGNGPYTLYAYAFDVDGHSASLGTKTIAVDNAHASKPFGSIDTPGYGETRSGTFVNFGWALTPAGDASCRINNGDVWVTVDSLPAALVSYGDARSDIAAAFPGFLNSANASGAYYVNTTTLTNGRHQIGWLVYDSCGRGDGIGSRFFNVLNAPSGDSAGARGPGSDPTGGAPLTALSRETAVAAGRDESRPYAGTLRPEAARRGAPAPAVQNGVVSVRRLGGAWESVPPNTDGRYVIDVPQDGRIEVRLPPLDGRAYAGAQEVGGNRRLLPVGSSLDASAGVFYWQPAPGFLGKFDLVFGPSSGAAVTSGDAVRVSVVVGPPMRAMIDTPQPETMVTQPFEVAGWAIDLAAEGGSGIDTVHVWAYPLTGESPIWLGVAVQGDPRPDVGALFGRQFDAAGYGLRVRDLPPGTYDLVVYPHRARTNTFDGAQIVRVVVR
ncbi:MAG: hypothetical protein NTV05_16625 [Acidobacteria bacterium]|nr:hypothetical protein [Acidobacteriota bacterium]